MGQMNDRELLKSIFYDPSNSKQEEVDQEEGSSKIKRKLMKSVYICEPEEQFNQAPEPPKEVEDILQEHLEDLGDDEGGA